MTDTPPDLPVVPIVHEGDVTSGRVMADRFATPDTDDDGDQDAAAVVHHERFGDDAVTQAVASVEALVDRARETMATPPREGARTTNLLLSERLAHVVQATHASMDTVVAHLVDRQGIWRQRLRIDGQLTPRRGRVPQETMFAAKLRMPVAGHRKVTLRVYPTPSANLTVIEMLPRRRWMPQTRRYLHAGVPAITALMRELASPASRSD